MIFLCFMENPYLLPMLNLLMRVDVKYLNLKIYQKWSRKMSEPETWIFQANPNKYPIRESIAKESKELWTCNQHTQKIKDGDRVLIWVSGKAAGVYAIGSILSVPVLQPDSPKGVSYWYNPIEGLQTRARALVK
jgi:hypothetical protein